MTQQHLQHLSLQFAYSLQFRTRWQRSLHQPASPLFIRHQDLARTMLTWQGTTWAWQFLEQESLWQVPSVAAEPCDVSDFHPSKSRPFGSSSWKSVWVRSPLSWRDTDSSCGAGGALTVGGRRRDRWGFIFASELEGVLDVYPNTHGFPGFSWSLDLFMPSTQGYSTSL